MKKDLTRDDIARRIKILLYQEQMPITRLAKDCGMDAITITKAEKGDITLRSLKRFTQFFEVKDKGLQFYDLKENRTILPKTANKRHLVYQVGKLYQERRTYIPEKIGMSKVNLELQTIEKLTLMYIDVEYELKALLLKDAVTVIEKYHIWLYDKWDYWQWKEKIDMTLKDTAR